MKVFIQLLLIFIVTVGIGLPEFISFQTDSVSSISFDVSTPDSDFPLEQESESDKEVETSETELFFVSQFVPMNFSEKSRLFIPHQCNLFDSYIKDIDLPPLV